MSKYKQRDIVYAEVHYVENKNRSKTRPVLIISNHHFDDVHEFVCIPLSMVGIKDELCLFLPNEGLSKGNNITGYLRFNKITTLNKSTIRNKKNEVTPEFFKKVVEKLNNLFQ